MAPLEINIPNDNPLESLKNGLPLVISTIKNMTLFPPGSPVYSQSFQGLYIWFTEFLNKFGNLNLTINRDGLYWAAEDEEPVCVFQERSGERLLVTPLFRDGIESLEFEAGLPEIELQAFLTLLIEFRSISDDGEDDLVTAIWGKDFSFIKYQVGTEVMTEDQGPDVVLLQMSKKIVDKGFLAGYEEDPSLAGAPPIVNDMAPVAKPVSSLFAFATLQAKQNEEEPLPVEVPPNPMDFPDEDIWSEELSDINLEAELVDDDFPELEELDETPGHKGTGSGKGNKTASKNLANGNVPDLDPEESRDFFKPPTSMAHGQKEPLKTLDEMLASTGDQEAFSEENMTSEDWGTPDDLENRRFDSYKEQLATKKSKAQGTGSERPENQAGDLDQADETLIGDTQKRNNIFGTSAENGNEEDYGKFIPESYGNMVQKAGEELFSRLQLENLTQEKLNFWVLTESEKKHLKELVQQEAERDYTRDCLELILILLNNHIKEPGGPLKGLGEFMTEVIADALSLGRIKYVNVFMDKMERLAQLANTEIPMVFEALTGRLVTREILEPFLLLASSYEWLRGHVNNLRKFLLRLPPELAFSLGAIYPSISEKALQNVILEIMALHLFELDGERSFLMVSSMGTYSILTLLKYMEAYNRPLPIHLLKGLTRHKNPSVRKLATENILKMGPDYFPILVHLLADPEPSIAQMVVVEVEKHRIPKVEQYLLSYLSENYNTQASVDEDYLVGCYRTLGKCGSKASIPFLKEILLKKSFMAIWGKGDNIHRQGAALALSLLPAETGAGELLHKASKSAFRDIRKAYSTADDHSKGARTNE